LIPEVFHNGVRPPRGPVGTLAAQGIPDVNHGENPRCQGDLLAAQAARISAIPPGGGNRLSAPVQIRMGRASR
jgi:hypothetical protein